MTKENTYKSTCSLTKLWLLPFIKTKLFNEKRVNTIVFFFFFPFNNKG